MNKTINDIQIDFLFENREGDKTFAFTQAVDGLIGLHSFSKGMANATVRKWRYLDSHRSKNEKGLAILDLLI